MKLFLSKIHWPLITITYMLGILWSSLRPELHQKHDVVRETVHNGLHVPAYMGLTFLLVCTFQANEKSFVSIMESMKRRFSRIIGNNLKRHDDKNTTASATIRDRSAPIRVKNVNFFITMWTFIISASWGWINEIVQSHVPGRTCSVSDEVLNIIGTGLSLILIKKIKWLSVLQSEKTVTNSGS